MNINSYNFSNKRALIRVDFNVPVNNDGQVTDDTRIRMAVPTIKKVLESNGSVVLMSHMGRPKDQFEKKFSLSQIVSTVEKNLGQSISFAEDCIGDQAFELTENLQNGQVVLLENLRFYAEEKKGDSSFALKLAKHGDVYINDAFGTAHRAHASTAVIANYFKENKMFGRLIEGEIKSVEKVLGSDGHPLTAIVGGAKVSSKITILSNLISKVDHIIIGGGMAYTFVKAMGGNIGKSLVEDDYLTVASEILENASKNNVKIHLPVDTLTAKEFSNEQINRLVLERDEALHSLSLLKEQQEIDLREKGEMHLQVSAMAGELELLRPKLEMMKADRNQAREEARSMLLQVKQLQAELERYFMIRCDQSKLLEANAKLQARSAALLLKAVS